MNRRQREDYFIAVGDTLITVTFVAFTCWWIFQ